MSLTIKLPEDKTKKEYSLFVNSKIIYLNKIQDMGTLIIAEGCGVAFYSASNSRRAIVFSELNDNNSYIPLLEGNLPYFKEKVKVIYKARGRKIELLKFMCFNLEQKYGDRVYELGVDYWLMISSFIDSYNKKGSNKRQLFLLTDKYMKKLSEKKNENI